MSVLLLCLSPGVTRSSTGLLPQNSLSSGDKANSPFSATGRMVGRRASSVSFAYRSLIVI